MKIKKIILLTSLCITLNQNCIDIVDCDDVVIGFHEDKSNEYSKIQISLQEIETFFNTRCPKLLYEYKNWDYSKLLESIANWVKLQGNINLSLEDLMKSDEVINFCKKIKKS